MKHSVTNHFQDNPEPWDFAKMETTPDIVVINLGTNDNNVANNVSSAAFVDAYKKLIQGVHGKYPNAQVVVMVSGNTSIEIKRLILSLLYSIFYDRQLGPFAS